MNSFPSPSSDAEFQVQRAVCWFYLKLKFVFFHEKISKRDFRCIINTLSPLVFRQAYDKGRLSAGLD